METQRKRTSERTNKREGQEKRESKIEQANMCDIITYFKTAKASVFNMVCYLLLFTIHRTIFLILPDGRTQFYEWNSIFIMYLMKIADTDTCYLL